MSNLDILFLNRLKFGILGVNRFTDILVALYKISLNLKRKGLVDYNKSSKTP